MAARGIPVYAWKGETDEEYVWLVLLLFGSILTDCPYNEGNYTKGQYYKKNYSCNLHIFVIHKH
jgi:hypothetical protein